jgi:cephalosporin hydroxylase
MTFSDSLKHAAQAFLDASVTERYSYNFTWLSRPIIQYPQDIVATQELIWSVKPDLVIETGIAHGGSLILSASVLAMIEYAEAVENGTLLDPSKPTRRVLGVDIDIRAHNRAALEAHPMISRIDMIQGSSVAPDIVAQVHERARGAQRVLVFLDSNHTHAHVLAELEAYAPLVSKDSYCVVFDTMVEDVPAGSYPDRPWDKGDNPKTAVHAYLAKHPEFEIDRSFQDKLLITVAPDGFLKRVG